MESILLKLSDVADEVTEAQIYKFVANAMKDSNIEIVHLSDKLKTSNNQHLIPTIILSIVAGFLTINVALGMFGVLWYNINKRKTEIGLRRAVGASAGSVKMQLVLESLLIATLAIAVGSFFAIQFPLLNVFDLPAAVYLMALLLAIAFIYLLVLICSFYPGKQAAAIYPAIALHEE
jgi:putative ABC transport system permease protein